MTGKEGVVICHLIRIERDLARSDPSLNTLFASFTVQTQGVKMPAMETTRTRRWRLFGWLGRRADGQREGSDGRARPRTLP